MKLVIGTILLLSSLLLAENIKVLVTGIESSGLSSEESQMVEDKVRSEIGRRNLFTLVNRSNMEEVFEEAAFQNLVNDETALSEADLLGLRDIVQANYLAVVRTTATPKLHQISLRMISLNTSLSEVVTEESKSGFESFLRTTIALTVDALEAGLAAKSGGNLTISSKPDGAEVVFNRISIGDTPVQTGFQSPGEYLLTLTMENYKALSDTISISLGDNYEKKYSLEYTDEFASSQKDSNRKSKRKRRIPIYISLGALSVGSFVGAIYMDSKLKDESESRDALYKTYKTSSSTTEATQLGVDIDESSDEIANYSLYRNILYGVSGASAAALTLTIIF
jgi:hypothetical protein